MGVNALKMPGHFYLPYAIGDADIPRPDTLPFVEPNNALTEKFQSLGEPLHVASSRGVQTRRLDDLPETSGADFLKVDVQGGASRRVPG